MPVLSLPSHPAWNLGVEPSGAESAWLLALGVPLGQGEAGQGLTSVLYWVEGILLSLASGVLALSAPGEASLWLLCFVLWMWYVAGGHGMWPADVAGGRGVWPVDVMCGWWTWCVAG